MERAAGKRGLERARSVDHRVRQALIRALSVEKRRDRRQPALGADERRLRQIERLGRRDLSASVNQEDLKWVTSDPNADFPPAPMSRHQLLAGLHEALRPRTYFEIGVRFGDSLALSRARTIGVDPAYAIRAPLHCDIQTFTDTSDDFFARPGAFEHFDGAGIDLAFIDGMHMSEYVLRDFMNAEAHAAPGAVFVLDDVLPRNDLEAYRIRRTKAWAGDVYKVLEVLRTHRPDLTIVPVNTAPTGTVVIAGLDPDSTVLREAYDQIEPSLLAPDPQIVPDRVKLRSDAVDPRDLLASDVFKRVVALRAEGGDHAVFRAVYGDLADVRTCGPSEDTAPA